MQCKEPLVKLFSQHQFNIIFTLIICPKYINHYIHGTQKEPSGTTNITGSNKKRERNKLNCRCPDREKIRQMYPTSPSLASKQANNHVCRRSNKPNNYEKEMNILSKIYKDKSKAYEQAQQQKTAKMPCIHPQWLMRCHPLPYLLWICHTTRFSMNEHQHIRKQHTLLLQQGEPNSNQQL